jgi:invasion protein IalB
MNALNKIAAIALAAAIVAPAATAQDNRVVNGSRYGQWTVTCEATAVNETACVLSQRLVRTEDNAFLADILAFWSRDGEQAYMAARVPTGVYFPSGFAFKPEDSEDRFEFTWQSCGRDLCEALIEIDAETLTGLESGAPIFAGYRPALGMEPLVFQLDFTGIGEGMTALAPDQ